MARNLISLIVLCVLLTGCTRHVKIWEGPTGPDNDPIWSIENAPSKGEVAFERSIGGEEGETIKFTVKKEGSSFPNPFKAAWDLVRLMTAKILASDVAVPVN